MTGDQLLQELQKARLLDGAAAAKLEREAFLSGRSVEEMIYAKRLVDDRKVAELKSAILKIPYEKVDAAKFDAKLLGAVPEKTARTYAVAPLARKENLLIVGMVNPDDQKAQEALRFIARASRLNLGVYVISWGDWQAILQKYSPYRSEITEAVQSLHLKPAEAGGVVRIEEVPATEEENAPVIRIVARTFKEAVAERASDVHIEPQENYLRIRFRVDGDLREVASLPLELAQPAVSRVKVLSNLKIDETRIPQDGRFRTRVLNRDIDFRVATFPTPAGEKVAVRVLDPSVGLQSFASLPLAKRSREVLERGLARPYGMIVVSGPTGSGKSTTLYSMLQNLNKEDVNIVSLEDPVEYLVSGINQSQVKPEIGYDFASGLRQILRQDPDVIMVGEMRDDETAGLAVRAALTGHIVLSTIHTNNASSIISRLIDMKVEPFLLPVSLAVMVSQRLVGQLCSSCRKADVAPPPVQKIISDALRALPSELTSQFREPYRIYHAPGCPNCKGRGIAGRIALYEAFEMSPALQEIITSGSTLQRIFKEARNQGMVTLREDGVLKALAGEVLIEEVIRETEEF